MEDYLFKVPDHLRRSLWGWSWNKSSWPGKKGSDATEFKKEYRKFEDAVLEDPSSIHFLNRARFLLEYGEYEKALSDFMQAYQESKKDLKILAERADLFLLLGHDQEALHDYLIVLEELPKEHSVHLKLAYLYLTKGNYYDSQFHTGCFSRLNIPSENLNILLKYLRYIKIRSAALMQEVIKGCEKDYTEESLFKRAKTKEKVFDLVGAVEDYLMLYLLFEKEEYLVCGNKLKMKILEMAEERKRKLK